MAAATTTTDVLPVLTATFTAPTNIAVIKYWGKRDSALNLPINSSLSVTLNQDDLRTTTTAVASPHFAADRLWLNGREEDISTNKRMQTVFRLVRERACDKKDSEGCVVVSAEDLRTKYGVHVVSRNTFPTAAGLASSAAGFACLSRVLAELFNVPAPGSAGVDALGSDDDLSTIARQGSGSASRSLYGGFVKWEMGHREDGADSRAVPVAPADHWPEMEVLIAVVSAAKKDTASTAGMTTSVATSDLLRHRAEAIVPRRMTAMEDAIRARDFAAFGRLTMADSNQFHATCLDTFPPIFYMNDMSRRLIQLVHRVNDALGGIKAAYTFDAGPNAVIYTTRDVTPILLAAILAHFPPTDTSEESMRAFVSNPESLAAARAASESLPESLRCDPADAVTGGLRYVYKTTPGDGPRRLDDSLALADLTTGLPKVDV